MRSFYQSIVQGELLTFCRRLQYIEVILKKSENGVVYQKMGEEELIRLMIAVFPLTVLRIVLCIFTYLYDLGIILL